MINIKYCKRCKNPFDIATNYDLCPNCRKLINELPKIKTAYELQTQIKKNNGRKTKMAYKEIEPTFFTYEEEGDFIEGILVQKQEHIGANDSWLYSIETLDGVKNVWGSAILDSKLTFVKVGDKVKITYKGLGEAKEGRSPPKIFKVEVDK